MAIITNMCLCVRACACVAVAADSSSSSVDIAAIFQSLYDKLITHGLHQRWAAAALWLLYLLECRITKRQYQRAISHSRKGIQYMFGFLLLWCGRWIRAVAPSSRVSVCVYMCAKAAEKMRVLVRKKNGFARGARASQTCQTCGSACETCRGQGAF